MFSSLSACAQANSASYSQWDRKSVVGSLPSVGMCGPSWGNDMYDSYTWAEI